MSEIEVDEVARLVGHVRAEVAAHDAMPCGVVFLVELFLDEGSNVLERQTINLLKISFLTFNGIICLERSKSLDSKVMDKQYKSKFVTVL